MRYLLTLMLAALITAGCNEKHRKIKIILEPPEEKMYSAYTVFARSGESYDIDSLFIDENEVIISAWPYKIEAVLATDTIINIHNTVGIIPRLKDDTLYFNYWKAKQDTIYIHDTIYICPVRGNDIVVNIGDTIK